MRRERLLGQFDDQRLEIGVRAAALGLAYAASLITSTADEIVLQLVLLTALAVAAVLPVQSRQVRRWRPALEALAAGLIIATVDPYDPSLLPYLVTPVLSAGLIGGWTLAVITTGAMVFGLLTLGAAGLGGITAGSEYLVDAVQWSLLALVVGLLAAWVQRVRTQTPDDRESYLEAARLLTQLRDLSRELSGGLDAVSIGHALLDDLRSQAGITRGWVFAYRDGEVPQPLAFGPGIEVALTPDVAPGTVWARAIERRSVQIARGPLSSDPSMSGVVVPVCARDAVIGLVALERRGQPWSRGENQRLWESVDAEATRLDAAILFDEVRTTATAEERQRLAREIHDGVAQEVASLGYMIDDLQGRRGSESLGHDLARIREELTRIVGELRYSIFDLRREIGPGASLTSVLADHARQVCETAGINLHLELSESPTNLRPAVESELLRIAQEAIANARKHSKAKNLWVTCLVDASDIRLTVEDDGRGLSPPREDSFGLAIMQERAARAGCQVAVANRRSGGTSVLITRAPIEAVRGDGERSQRA